MCYPRAEPGAKNDATTTRFPFVTEDESHDPAQSPRPRQKLRRRRVVDGVDYEVAPGEIVGLLGPNGAGKTTTFRMSCGMIDPDAGKVTLQDKDVTNWPMYKRSREGGMGYLAQESSVFRKLSVQNNLLGVMEMLGMNRKERRRRCDELLEQFGVTKLRKAKAQSLSGGERRRVEIARCLVSNPQIILLDEPFTGIDPVTIASIQEIVRDLRSRGISILITDHQVRETLEITDRSYVIRAGQVLCHGRPRKCCGIPKRGSITSARGWTSR
jgi:lipopolysaccharide export system ATP-binding protein